MAGKSDKEQPEEQAERDPEWLSDDEVLGRLQSAKKENLSDDARLDRFISLLIKTRFGNVPTNFYKRIAKRLFEHPSGVAATWRLRYADNHDGFAKAIRSSLAKRELAIEKRKLLVQILLEDIIPEEVAKIHDRIATDGAYWGIQAGLGISQEASDDALDKLIGTYQYWRYTNRVVGFCVKGMYQIFKSGGGAARVFAYQQYDPDKFPTDSHLSGRAQQYPGYAIKSREARRIFMIFMNKDTNSIISNFLNEVDYVEAMRDSHVSNLFEARQKFRPGVVLQMSGTSVGVDGNITFSSPIYIERVSMETEPEKDKDGDVKKLVSSLNIYPLAEVPERVRGTLSFLSRHNNRYGD